jgi:hypothetical protein
LGVQVTNGVGYSAILRPVDHFEACVTMTRRTTIGLGNAILFAFTTEGKTGFQSGDTEGILKGKTFPKTAIYGMDFGPYRWAFAFRK